jgi:preprotein translocase subunit Sec63
MVQQNPDPYTVLGVSPEASHTQITHAYRKQVRALHPDARITAAQTTTVADAQLRDVLAAYAQLRHPDGTSTTLSRASDAPAPSTCTPTSSRGVQIPVIRRDEHAQTPPAQRPPLWAGPVRRHRKSVDGR